MGRVRAGGTYKTFPVLMLPRIPSQCYRVFQPVTRASAPDGASPGQKAGVGVGPDSKAAHGGRDTPPSSSRRTGCKGHKGQVATPGRTGARALRPSLFEKILITCLRIQTDARPLGDLLKGAVQPWLKKRLRNPNSIRPDKL